MSNTLTYVNDKSFQVITDLNNYVNDVNFRNVNFETKENFVKIKKEQIITKM